MSHHVLLPPRRIRHLALVAVLLVCSLPLAAVEFTARTASQWGPFLEWSVQAPGIAGNPYDVVAWATFTHPASGEIRRVLMFHDGGDTWRWRFTATRTGSWTFVTTADEPGLQGHSGSVEVSPQTNPNMRGFLTPVGESDERRNKWGWSGTGEAFTPQLVMYLAAEGSNPRWDSITDAGVDADLDTFFMDHGFNGVHNPVMLPERWMTGANGDVDPRRDTFEKLERIITRSYAAGGMTLVWIWGDEARGWSPAGYSGGINGVVDRRLQRYIAARLGPLPGWVPSYGFDLWEWVSGAELDEWRNYIRDHTDYPLIFGGRSSKNVLDQLSENMDYASYEVHHPRYDTNHLDPSWPTYLQHVEARPGKPSLSEDRFRRTNLNGSGKSYTPEETRQAMWHSVMAGGVGNIWGNLRDGGGYVDGSAPYPNANHLLTHARFWRQRFLPGMARANDRSDNAWILRDGDRLVAYRESTDRIHLDLRGIAGERRLVAVDTVADYLEIDLGTRSAGEHVIDLPRVSDWAIAVGDFTTIGPPPTVVRQVSLTNPADHLWAEADGAGTRSTSGNQTLIDDLDAAADHRFVPEPASTQ